MKVLSAKMLLGVVGGLLSLSASALTVIADFQTTGADAGSFVSCTGGDRCSGDVLPMTFYSGALAAKAYKGSSQQWQSAVVVQDNFYDRPSRSLSWVGLGVYSSNPIVSSDDNITSGEVLELDFGSGVSLTSVTLRAEGHFANFAAGTSFAVSSTIDGMKWYFDFVPGQNEYDLTAAPMGYSSSWFFHFDLEAGEQYYVSGVTAVPEPGTYALMAAGLLAVGFASRRKNQPR